MMKFIVLPVEIPLYVIDNPLIALALTFMVITTAIRIVRWVLDILP